MGLNKNAKVSQNYSNLVYYGCPKYGFFPLTKVSLNNKEREQRRGQGAFDVRIPINTGPEFFVYRNPFN